MLTYKGMDNLTAVEIELSERVSTEEFDKARRSSRLSSRAMAGCVCSRSRETGCRRGRRRHLKIPGIPSASRPLRSFP